MAGRRLTRVIGSAALVLAAWPAWWFTGVLAGTPPPVVLVGVVAATCWAALVCLLGHRWHETPRVILATFFWGAIVAPFVSAQVNDALLVRVGSGGGDLVPVLLAPLVEEGAKAGALVAALLLARDEVHGPLDGIVYGALVGIGFAMTENFSYLTLAALQGGTAGLLRGVYLRAVLGGPVHATFTAIAGAALVKARTARRIAAGLATAFAGVLAAVVQHVVWNGLASRTLTGVLCGPQYPGACRPEPDARALLVQAPLVVVLFLGPGVLMLLAIGRLASRQHAASGRPVTDGDASRS